MIAAGCPCSTPDSHVCSHEQWLPGGFHGDFLLRRYPDLKTRDGPNTRAETREVACSLPRVRTISHEGMQTLQVSTPQMARVSGSSCQLGNLRGFGAHGVL